MLVVEPVTATSDAAAVLRDRSRLVDEIVAQAWRDHLAPAFPDGLALVAVGGYGRAELFPYSDIDLLILAERAIDADRKAALSVFLRTLWDANLRLSQSVRSLSECCALDPQNVELSISLLDQRFLAGDQVLHNQLAQRLPRFFLANRATLLKHVTAMTAARHGKFQNTIYHLEPNIKEGPGGLRDFHAVRWLHTLRGGEPSDVLSGPQQFLFDLRIRLHNRYRRDHNVLTFDVQEELSPDPAAWMREYFRHARQIHLTALREMELAEALTESNLLRQFRDWRSRVSNSDFTVSRERLYFRSPQNLAADPELALRLFVFAARHGLRPALEAERRLSEALPSIAGYYGASRPVWPLLKELLSLPHAGLALRCMHETGVLLAIFPEWQTIECLVTRDFYHRYTVDEHTLVAIDSVVALRKPNEGPRQRFANLLAETEDLPLLLAALLFHDAGKAQGLESHAERSSALAAVALERIRMPEHLRRRVRFLIDHHLDLSAVMMARDIAEPAVVRELADRVETVENLKLLTLMTFADIDAVNPAALTPWRMDQLWRVYLRTYNELTRELQSERIEDAGRSPAQAAFLRGLPVRYLRTHSPEQIDAHLRLDEQRRALGTGLDVRRTNGYYVATVVANDRAGLFASLAGALSAFGMDIVKAEAFSNAAGTVVDTFAFADPMRTLELNPVELDRLKLTLQRVANGKEDVRKLLKARAKPLASRPKLHFRPTVAFDSTSSDSATLIEIVAEDRPGLLYDLASTLSAAGCNIEVVLIDTEAHKAIDVFYVTEADRKLTPERQGELRTQLLAVCASE